SKNKYSELEREAIKVNTTQNHQKESYLTRCWPLSRGPSSGTLVQTTTLIDQLNNSSFKKSSKDLSSV
ncbi:hypothetical protein Anas_14575, partial [Armadillidium nasatum]